jgi:hypothetical protein
MKRLTAIVVTLAMASAIAGCGDADPSDRLIASTSTPADIDTPVSPPQLPPTATATPPPLITSHGWLVHRREGGVFASRLDGNGEVALDAGTVAPGIATYAGSARLEDETWVYLLTPASRAASAHGEPTYDVLLTRTSLTSGRSERVFELPSPIILPGWRSRHTSVSPDGARFAFAGDEGIWIVGLKPGLGDMLVPNECPSPGSERCPHYIAPLWSPRGDALLITKQFYEGSHLVLVRMSDVDAPIEFEDVSGDLKTWSPDGARFCSFAEIYVPRGTWVVETDTLERRDWDTTISPPEGVKGSGCALDRDRLAMSFTRDVDATAVRRIAMIQLLGHGAGIGEVAAPSLCTNIDGWLPGGEGLVVSNHSGCEGVDDPGPFVLLGNGTFRSLPFDAGEVIAIIPE